MSGISKRVSGSWVSASYGIMKTATDTITSLPADLYADGNSATVGLVGNMSQTGTPTPQNPIQPQECGERTNNLLDLAKIEKGRINQTSGEVTVVSDTTVLTVSGNNVTVTTTKEWRGFISDYIPTTEALKFSYGSLSNVESGTNFYCYFYAYDSSKQYLGYVYQGAIPEGTAYLRASFQFNVAVTNAVVSEIMLNTGSTAMDFEPNGFKLPVQCGGVTTPVYLGEVESTRRIKKLVFTGEEETGFYRKNTTSADNSLYYIRFAMLQSVPLNNSPLYCTHLQNLNYTPSEVVGINVAAVYTVIYFNLGLDVMNAQPSGNTVAGLKEYLAQQYAAGTPVTVWYVLATETTGIVNEPIRKIGDYADEVSNISIPVTAGGDTISVGTTVQPSEVSVNYHGWHPIADVHERDNGAWT